MDLALNNLQRLICHKNRTKPNQTKAIVLLVKFKALVLFGKFKALVLLIK